jgi:uncharacterized protein
MVKLILGHSNKIKVKSLIMKRYLLLIFLIFSLFSCKQKIQDNKSAGKINLIEFGQVDSLYSEILEESRKIWIYIPESYSAKDKNKKYPVLYLLDGDSHFYSVSSMIRQLSSLNGNTVLPEMIVVAILNTDRSRDLTPTHVDIDFFTGDSIQYNSGGGGKFLSFMEDELIPYIEKTYPAASFRTLVGHSFGGLSVINSLISKKHLFDNYIAIDPSLWWDNQAFLNFSDSILSNQNFENKSLYVAVANTMNEGMDIQSVRNDTSINSVHIRSILKFVHSMEMKKSGLNFSWKYYNDDDHGSVPLIAEYDGLRYLFRWHPFKGFNQIINSASEMTPEELLELPKAHFEEVSRHFGFEVLPAENLINGIGYFLLSEKMPEKALFFFDLNIKNFPNSSNVYDSRGDCYLAEKDTIKALEYFYKAMEREDLDTYRDKIKKLEQKIK